MKLNEIMMKQERVLFIRRNLSMLQRSCANSASQYKQQQNTTCLSCVLQCFLLMQVLVGSLGQKYGQFWRQGKPVSSAKFQRYQKCGLNPQQYSACNNTNNNTFKKYTESKFLIKQLFRSSERFSQVIWNHASVRRTVNLEKRTRPKQQFSQKYDTKNQITIKLIPTANPINFTCILLISNYPKRPIALQIIMCNDIPFIQKKLHILGALQQELCTCEILVGKHWVTKEFFILFCTKTAFQPVLFLFFLFFQSRYCHNEYFCDKYEEQQAILFLVKDFYYWNVLYIWYYVFILH
eukprot:TRINITY_DN7489_c0_g1_i3.p1 TRINITY_DN7489_c0_g1~~TRINITY_DN7489_c0_g1_i3.p1  ORF type:complete len:294 (-),score=-7.97 TRINITY_DN7489_c0_g1_i3:900-1781(-)